MKRDADSRFFKHEYLSVELMDLLGTYIKRLFESRRPIHTFDVLSNMLCEAQTKRDFEGAKYA